MPIDTIAEKLKQHTIYIARNYYLGTINLLPSCIDLDDDWLSLRLSQLHGSHEGQEGKARGGGGTTCIWSSGKVPSRRKEAIFKNWRKVGHTCRKMVYGMEISIKPGWQVFEKNLVKCPLPRGLKHMFSGAF